MNGARLADDLIRVQRGRVVVYITDTVFETGWVNRIRQIASGADLVVCESTFLQADAHLASVYHHMTSLQAAEVACQLDARKLMLFHILSRYHPNLYQAVLEARTVFPRTEMIEPTRRNQVSPPATNRIINGFASGSARKSNTCISISDPVGTSTNFYATD